MVVDIDGLVLDRYDNVGGSGSTEDHEAEPVDWDSVQLFDSRRSGRSRADGRGLIDGPQRLLVEQRIQHRRGGLGGLRGRRRSWRGCLRSCELGDLRMATARFWQDYGGAPVQQTLVD